jgi:hypothetical protein
MATPSFGASDNEILRCLHCDEAIETTLRVIRSDELEAAGYAVLEASTCGNGGGCSVVRCRTGEIEQHQDRHKR